MNRPEPYRGATYYDLPAIKPAPWEWHVPAYVAIGGAAGGAQVVATMAWLAGAPGAHDTLRHARLIGTAGSILGSPLLIADLKTPNRFHHMLRILRTSSPMSIGSYALTAFGAFSAIGALGSLAPRGRAGAVLRTVADLTQVPAAATGALMGTYTAALLSATSVPLWAAAPRLLAAEYGASATASGAALLALSARGRSAEGLDRLAALGAGLTLALSVAHERSLARDHLDEPLRHGPAAALHRTAQALYAVPLACQAIRLARGRRSPALATAASLAILAAGTLTRFAVMKAGGPSAERPRDTFGFTRPRNLPPDEPRPSLPESLRREPAPEPFRPPSPVRRRRHAAR